MYTCPPMPSTSCPPPCPTSQPSTGDPSSRYYREIGAAMIGNQLIIRMERDKNKSRKSRGWDPPCDCDVVEIQRPTSNEGPKILNGVDNNRILFRVQSNSQLSKENDNGDMPQAISYEIGQCKGGSNTNDQCRTFTVYPVLDGSGAQEVHTDRVTEDNENVFMLKVRKKTISVEEPKRNIELELRTPRPPIPPATQPEVRHQPSPLERVADKKSVCEEKPRKEVTTRKKRKKK